MWSVLGGGMSSTDTDGGTWSILMPERVAAPTLPARSVAWPDAESPVPPPASTTGAVTLPGATPDSASVAVNETVTGPLFHPLLFAAGDALAATIGGVLSRLTVALPVATLPALSVAVPVTI